MGGLITGLKKCFKLSYIIGASQNTFLNLIETNVVKSHPFQDKLRGGKYLGGGGGGGGTECNIILDIKFSQAFIRYKDTR